MKPVVALLALILLVSSAASCGRNSPPVGAEKYLARFVDPATSPREDFFQHAVGKWLRDNPIPADESSWGIYHVVQEETYARLQSLCESATANREAPRGSNAQKIGDFWFASRDTAAIAAQGMTPLAEEFARIEAVGDAAGLVAALARLQYIGSGAAFATYIFQDEMQSDRYALHLYQGGIGLPDRDYYFDEDERSQMLRREYEGHVARMFELLGDAPSTARAQAAVVMAMETDLAGASRELEDLRDPHANYNAMSLDALAALAPSVRWRELLDAANIHDVDTVIVGQPEFFREVERSLASRSLDDWKAYLRWHLAHTFAEQAGGEFEKEDFRFFGTILNGTPEQRPRWKRMLDQEEHYLGDALGQLYVAEYFSPRTKERYERLTDEIFAAFGERVKALDWMSDQTKERALRKLHTVTKKVGYPTKWKDYAGFEVDRSSFLGNCLRGNIWWSDYYSRKLHEPVDRLEWEMTPQTYNAYYNPSNNEIVMPAAVFLLPGIPDSLVDDAIVYAYAGGTTIGHEITHGFDDTGRQFDEKGNLKDWWTPQDGEEFNRRAALIVQQFNQYRVVDSLYVNGEATQGENIADLGGMVVAWDAFTKTEQYTSGKKIGGLTPAQRFFLGWGLAWMNQRRPESMAVRVKTDVHAPPFLRVNGPASNLPQFYEAFGVEPGDPMWRADSVRVKIW